MSDNIKEIKITRKFTGDGSLDKNQLYWGNNNRRGTYVGRTCHLCQLNRIKSDGKGCSYHKGGRY